MATPTLEIILRAKDDASRIIQQTQGNIDRLGESMSKMGRKMTMYVSAPLAAIGGLGIKMGADLEQAITNAAAVTGYAGEEFEKARDRMEKLARTLGETTVFTARDAANAMYDLASKGFKPAEMSLEELQPYLDLAAATQVDLKFATETVTSAIRMFGLKTSDAKRVADVYTKTIGSSAATMDKLGISMQYVGPLMKATGTSIEEASAFLAALYNKGFDASIAATALRGVMSELMTVGSDLNDVLKRVGLTEADISLESHSLIEVLQTLADAGMTNAEVMDVFGKRAGPAALALFDVDEAGVRVIDRIRELTLTLEESGGEAERVATIQLDTLQGSMKLLRSRVEELLISIGQRLMPMFRNLIDNFLMPMAGRFNELDDRLQAGIVSTGMFVIALGPMLWIGGKLIGVFRSLAAAVMAVNVALGISTTAAATAAGSVGALAAIVGSVSWGIHKLSETMGVAVDTTAGWKDPLGAAFGLLEKIGSSIDNLISPTKEATEAVDEFANMQEEVGQVVDTVMEQAIEKWDEFAETITDATEETEKAKQSWEALMATMESSYKDWERTGASAEVAFQIMIEMSGKTREELARLFSDAQIGAQDWATSWEEMCRIAEIDAGIYIENVKRMTDAQRALADEVRRTTAEMASQTAQAGLPASYTATGALAGAEAEGWLRKYQSVMPPQLRQHFQQVIAGGGSIQLPVQYDGNILGYQRGGIVPGPIGQPQMAMVHGGERILPPSMTASVNVYVQGGTFLGDEADARQWADVLGARLQEKVRGGWSLS